MYIYSSVMIFATVSGKVMTVSLDTHTLDDIIPVIHTSLGIIGMHGSLLSLASFLRQGSIVVELFPYAVNPDHYTPYQTLARLPGMLLAYRAWANQDKDSSVMHPDWSAEFGGVEYLPVEEQSSIVSQVNQCGSTACLLLFSLFFFCVFACVFVSFFFHLCFFFFPFFPSVFYCLCE